MSRARAGGPKGANDLKGTGLPANALLYDTGWQAVQAFATIEPLRPGLSPSQRRRRKILVWPARVVVVSGARCDLEMHSNY